MKQFECPYFDECGLLCNQTNENCRIKELFEDFYKVEKLYIEANAKCENLRVEIWDLNSTVTTWKEQYKKLKDQNHELKQCIYEIEEIVKSSLDACHACNSSSSCMKCDKGEILQKIKEVKGE